MTRVSRGQLFWGRAAVGTTDAIRRIGRVELQGFEQVVVGTPPPPSRQSPTLSEPPIGPEPFDPVIDPPFLDLALRLAERMRSALSSTDRKSRPTPSTPGSEPRVPTFAWCDCPVHRRGKRP